MSAHTSHNSTYTSAIQHTRPCKWPWHSCGTLISKAQLIINFFFNFSKLGFLKVGIFNIAFNECKNNMRYCHNFYLYLHCS